jgi:predicted O-methyltransferase YrrM
VDLLCKSYQNYENFDMVFLDAAKEEYLKKNA